MNFQLKSDKVVGHAVGLDEHINRRVAKFEQMIPDSSFFEFELETLTKPNDRGHCRAKVTLDLPGEKNLIRLEQFGQSLSEASDVVLDRLDEIMSEWKKRQKSHRA